MPSEPGLRAHLQRMHELRPGLHLHSDDAHDARDLTAQTEIGVGLRIVLLLEGAVDVSYGGERVALRPFGGDPARLTEMDAVVAYLQSLGRLTAAAQPAP